MNSMAEFTSRNAKSVNQSWPQMVGDNTWGELHLQQHDEDGQRRAQRGGPE